MTRLAFRAALAGALLAATAAPALAVAIKHTSRVGGSDPDAAPMASTSRAAPPADASGPHYFDKAHDAGTRG